MTDIGYPFFKNMSFRNSNSKTSENQSINHAKFVCSE